MTITFPLGLRLSRADRDRLEKRRGSLPGETESAPGNRHPRGIRLSGRLPLAGGRRDEPPEGVFPIEPRNLQGGNKK